MSPLQSVGLVALVTLAVPFVRAQKKELTQLIPPPGVAGAPKIYSYKVLEEFTHDEGAFLQGLACTEKPDCETFYESTGLYGKTSVREVERRTGKVLRQQSNIDKAHFGEGLVKFKDEFILLLWRTNLVLVFDAATMEFKREMRSPMTNGWGLTIGPRRTDGGEPELIGTDSTDVLYFMKPSSDGSKLVETRRTQIHDGDRSVKWLNEIELIDVPGSGPEVWGMIWQTECILRVSPVDGAVLGYIHMDGLTRRARKSSTGRMDVLNGIAIDPDTSRIWVTGKKWPKLYEVSIIESPPDAADYQERLDRLRRQCIK